ncbi:AI-2E family transporter [Xiamenia xianingshaonis]|uniref:AI-2E family transporter n=1 Tax=Xiamenia xianingshaonis TaxID=2682776 RepID=UPI0028F74598|nr:AI-2E family transporter [Xiamenia xianingshaonis]
MNASKTPHARDNEALSEDLAGTPAGSSPVSVASEPSALGVACAPEADERRRQRDMRVKSAAYAIWAVIGACVLTGVGIYLLNILSVPIGIILWTVIIIFCLRGVVNGLEARGVSRVIGTAVAYVAMVVVLALLGLVLFSPMFGVGDQFQNLIQSIPGYVKDIAAWAGDLYVRYADVLSNFQVQQYLTDAMNGLVVWVSGFAQQSANSVVAIGSGVANTFVALGFALVIAFWILIDLPAIGREVKRIGGPRHEEALTMLYLTVTRVMGGYIKGTLLQCGIIGAGCIVLFAALKLPNAVALGVIAGVLNIIPIIGPWLGGALAAVVGLFVNVWVAIGVLVGTIIIQQIVYTFVSPKIMSESVDVHPALTFLALMTGSAIGGAMSGLSGSLVGMLASIPFVAVAKSVFVYYFEKSTGRRLVSTTGVFFKGRVEKGGVNPIEDATGVGMHVSGADEGASPQKRQDQQAGQTLAARFRHQEGNSGSDDDSDGPDV